MIRYTLEQIPSWVPLLGMVVPKGSELHTPLFTRLIEAAILGGVVLYGTTQVLGEKISSVKDQVSDVQIQQKEMMKDITNLKVEIARIKK